MVIRWTLAALAVSMVVQVLAAGRGGQTGAAGPQKPGVTRQPFGTHPDGTAVELFTLTNRQGVEVRAITYGAIITSIRVPDRKGTFADVVHGFDTLEGYLPRHPYFGAIVGRYGNRIGNARFTLDGRTYTLAANDGAQHLHGGVRGFDRYVWKGEPLPAGTGVTFSRTSPDGEEGYPGTVNVRVTYTLDDEGALQVEYAATTDRPTHINLTQHSYFNLSGHDSGNILSHEVTIHADRYTPVNEALIPTGELAPVEGTPFDFRKSTAVGARIDAAHDQITRGRGYDHNFVLTRSGGGLQPAARVFDPRSGRTLDVATTEPGMQFYTGNFLDGSVTGKGGVSYRHRSALCLETQHFPDSPNKPHFPTTVVTPGTPYQTRTVFRFGVAK